jgi:Arm DNA-binding domain
MAMRCALMAHPSASPAGAPHGHAQGSASATYDPQLLARSLVHRPSRAERGRLERGQIGPVPFPHVLRRKHPRAALTRRHGRGGARRHEIGLEDRVAGGRRRSEGSLPLVPRDDCCLERDIQTSLQLALTASAPATDSGGGSYFYRYRLGDRRREIGLGSRDKVSLADACKVAKAWAVLRDEGHDPIEARRRERADNVAKSRAQQPITFKQMAETYLQAHSTSYEPKLSPMVDDLRRLAGQAACRSSVAAREAFCMEHDAGADCEPAECSSYRTHSKLRPGCPARSLRLG